MLFCVCVCARAHVCAYKPAAIALAGYFLEGHTDIKVAISQSVLVKARVEKVPTPTEMWDNVCKFFTSGERRRNIVQISPSDVMPQISIAYLKTTLCLRGVICFCRLQTFRFFFNPVAHRATVIVLFFCLFFLRRVDKPSNYTIFLWC